MGRTYTLQSTETQAKELMRTLCGRLDLDIIPKMKEAGQKGDADRLVGLTVLYSANKAILTQLESLEVSLPWT